MLRNKAHFLSKIDNEELEKFRKKAVICYGHFNIVHPGHIRFLEIAKKQGDSLLVALLSDNNLPPGLYFNEEERAAELLQTQLVDQVIILDSGDLEDLATLVLPQCLVFGKEFENKYPPAISRAIDIVNSQGGRAIFHAGDIRYTNAKFLATTPDLLDQNRHDMFVKACKNQQIKQENLLKHIEQFKDQKVLVLGDSIVDQYVACDALGMSAEAPVLVVKELESKDYFGGAAIVASHINALGADCSFVSITGDDQYGILLKNSLEQQGINVNIISDPSRPTTHKIRYMVDQQKLFRVSRLSDLFLDEALEESIITSVREIAPTIDTIVVSDFVYGLVTPRVLKAIQEIAKEYDLLTLGDVQCSTQVGSATKFKNFTTIAATEREARIALNNHESGIEEIANTLIKATSCHSLLLKLGSEGFISYELKDKMVEDPIREHFPALVSAPLDLTGAGDSLLASMAVALSAGATLMESSAIGTTVAGLAVQKMGNVPVTQEELINLLKNEIQV